MLNFDASEHALEAPAIFVGQSCTRRAAARRFRRLDCAARSRCCFPATGALHNDRRAYYSASREKLRVLAERGAVGVCVRDTVADEVGSPWRAAPTTGALGMRLRGAYGKPLQTHPQLRASATGERCGAA